MEVAVFYDLDFRFRRALAPEGLTTFTHCMAALSDAAADAQRAGFEPGNDPAVQLLARRLARFSTDTQDEIHPDDALLREDCLTRLADLKHRPAIVALLRKGVDYLPQDLADFRREGQRTLRQLAVALGMDRSDYRLDYRTPNPSIAGDHELTSNNLYVRLSVERFGSAAITYRHPQWKGPGGQVRHASATALTDINALARQISGHLKLPIAAAQAKLI
ncbi:hypothetical protein NTCA1_47770 [Novosphingobium sp. TCA1]|nr:hypothetical protein NTCA1_47770 [Novosphingobium sp. TCA1]